MEQLQYEDPDFQQFVDDMEENGFEPYHYKGRFYYRGPAVNCGQGEFQDVIRATDVDVQWDDMGLGYVVYPEE